MGDRRMHLHLDLDVDGEPVSGQVGLVDAQPHEFTGYASLIATLESIRAEQEEEWPVLPADGVR
ncbi:MAG TPA: hypothetical protein VMU39_07455 [Solirubrobacteraceae bacterium]|nr:hypothetical protein [Solirubrobacteraceae bacterium]